MSDEQEYLKILDETYKYIEECCNSEEDWKTIDLKPEKYEGKKKKRKKHNCKHK